MPQALQLHQITKRFGSLVANDDISLDVQQGEVLALLGENGAGKSTLVSILFGHYVADSGHIEVFGEPLKPGDPKAALAAGVGIVHQHFALADNLTVLENIMLGTEPLWSLATKKGAARAQLMRASSQFGLEIEPDAKVGSLSVGQKQRVEILKALYRGAKLLILDEPTAVLTPNESESLFATLKTLVAQGMSIIFISHKLDEVLRVSDRVAVLRAGKLVAQALARETSAAQLASWMVGHAVEKTSSPTHSSVNAHTSIVCELRNVNAKQSDREQIKSVNLALRAGEITAIAGVSGNGQLALAQLLMGMLRATTGELLINGQPAPHTPAGFAQMGIARIPDDRKGLGVVADLPFWENAVSEHLRATHGRFSKLGFIKSRAARAHTEAILERFDVRGNVRGRDANRSASALSGGNMQKLILGRSLMRPDGATPPLVIAHQPTWGLDIGAVQFVQEQLRAARDNGSAVLLISDDLDEIFDMADRIAVMHSGTLSEARACDDWSRESIGLAMAGSAEV